MKLAMLMLVKHRFVHGLSHRVIMPTSVNAGMRDRWNFPRRLGTFFKDCPGGISRAELLTISHNHSNNNLCTASFTE